MSAGTASIDRRHVSELVNRCRRRWLFVQFVRAFLFAVAILLGLATALSSMADATSLAQIFAAVVFASVAAASIATLIRRRSSREVAAVIDRECGLQGRVAAALEFAEADDVVAALVAADAGRHLHVVVPSQLFPAALGAPFAATVLMVVVAAVLGMRGPRGALPSAVGNPSPLVLAGGVQALAQVPEQSIASDARPTGAEAAKPQATNATMRPDIAAEPRLSSMMSPMPVNAAGERQLTDSASERRNLQDLAKTAPALAAQPSASATTGEGMAPPTTSRANPRGALGASAAAGPGPAQQAPGSDHLRDGETTGAAGGVSGSRVMSPALAALPPATETPHASRAALVAAGARAEAALRRGDIPPGKRQMVRRYFEVLQQRSTP